MIPVTVALTVAAWSRSPGGEGAMMAHVIISPDTYAPREWRQLRESPCTPPLLAHFPPRGRLRTGSEGTWDDGADGLHVAPGHVTLRLGGVELETDCDEREAGVLFHAVAAGYAVVHLCPSPVAPIPAGEHSRWLDFGVLEDAMTRWNVAARCIPAGLCTRRRREMPLPALTRRFPDDADLALLPEMERAGVFLWEAAVCGETGRVDVLEWMGE